MLTNSEKELLEDPEGPLGGRALFESVWRGNLELGQAFLEFCEVHRPARYIDWSRELTDRKTANDVESVVQLELSTRDMGETVGAFLADLSTGSPALFNDAIGSLKIALGTEDIPIPRKSAVVQEKALLRAARARSDDLMEAHKAGKPYPIESLKALHATLRKFEDPPVDAHQFKALLDMFTDLEGLMKAPSRVRQITQYIHFNLPHYEPVLKEFVRWCEDPNRSQTDIVEIGISDWIPKLTVLEHIDRQHAAQTMRKVITSPKLEKRLNVFEQALQLE